MTAQLTPPYYAVIFSSQRRPGNDARYDETFVKLFERVQAQPGYLSHEASRRDDGFGITVSYWMDLESIKAWKRNEDHRKAQALTAAN